MNKSVLVGKWKQICRLVKGWWGNLINDDQKRFDGYIDEIFEQLESKYGYTQNMEEDEYKKE